MEGKKLVWIAAVVVLAVVLGAGAAWLFGFFGGDVTEEGIEVPEIALTPENFAQEAARISLVQELPEEAVLLLQFYDFQDGERRTAYSYVIEKEQIREGTLEKADVAMHIHAKYFEELTNRNLCSIIEKAKASNDMYVETSLSKTALVWKYKSMMRYRECLGF